DAPYVPGWDCHGLPIEHQVEKKIGKAGVKVDARRFRDACRKFASEQVQNQKRDFIRLGVFGDWERPYLTMDFVTEANIIRALGRMIEAGHLERGFKPVYWCIECGSALAEAEVEYENRTSPAIDVRFRFVEPPPLLEVDDAPVSLVIWTTTPWTLPANQAVALHPDYDYVLVACAGPSGTEGLVVAEELLSGVLTRAGLGSCEKVRRFKGSELEGLKLRHPFHDREVPVVLGNHVTLDAGTGAVHTAPGHGIEDFE